MRVDPGSLVQIATSESPCALTPSVMSGRWPASSLSTPISHIRGLLGPRDFAPSSECSPPHCFDSSLPLRLVSWISICLVGSFHSDSDGVPNECSSNACVPHTFWPSSWRRGAHRLTFTTCRPRTTGPMCPSRTTPLPAPCAPLACLPAHTAATQPTYALPMSPLSAPTA